MKKIFLSLALVFLISGIAFAQDLNGNDPTVFTDSATKITTKSTILNGHINSIGNYTGTTIGPKYHFEYGTSFPDGLIKTETQSEVDKLKYSAEIKNLKKNSLYYYMFVEETGTTLSPEIFRTQGDLKTFYIAKNGKGQMVDMCSIKPKLKIGAMNNGNVYLLQKYLYEAKYLNTTPDGNFGPKTRSALKKFQKEVGLPSTGVFDEVTSKQIVLCGQNQ